MDEDQITKLAVSFKTHGSQLVRPPFGFPQNAGCHRRTVRQRTGRSLKSSTPTVEIPSVERRH